MLIQRQDKGLGIIMLGDYNPVVDAGQMQNIRKVWIRS